MSSKKTIKVTQIASPIGKPDTQRATLIGLGLNKINRTRVLEDTPSIRGMIKKVSHLVKGEEADAKGLSYLLFFRLCSSYLHSAQEKLRSPALYQPIRSKP